MGQSGIDDAIREVTQLALEQRETKVAWCPVFLGASITLVDVDKPTGWVHVEPSLPYSRIGSRASYTIYKKFSEETVADMQHVFDELWEISEKKHRKPFPSNC